MVEVTWEIRLVFLFEGALLVWFSSPFIGNRMTRAREAAAAHRLFVTGGSDFHGRYGTPPVLGTCTVATDEAGAAVRGLFEREASLS